MQGARCSKRLAEREDVGLRARLEERDPEGPLADLARLAHELVHPARVEHAASVDLDVDAARRTGRVAVELHAEGDRIAAPSSEDEVRVTRMEAEGDACFRSVGDDLFPAGRPRPVERPLVQ